MSSIVKQIAKMETERGTLKNQLRDTTPDKVHSGNVVKRLAALTAEVQGLRARATGRVNVSAIIAPPARPAPATPATVPTEEQKFMAAYTAEKDPQLRSRLWRQHEEAKRASKGAK